ncbi:MAG: hypothetical protein MI757_14095 [Pirellulales bacterium]|nr:hypothetical protein [Pirellulales bacterium]
MSPVALAADSSATHLKWRSPVKDDPFQGVASAKSEVKRRDKVKWQPYRPYNKPEAAERVSTRASRPEKVVAAKPPTAPATRDSIARTTVGNVAKSKSDKGTVRFKAKAAVPATNVDDQIEGPELKLVQFDDPFAAPKKDDEKEEPKKDDPFGAPADAPKPDDKKDDEPMLVDPFAPPMLDDKKPGDLPEPTPADKDMSPPGFGEPEPADKPDPFAPPPKPEDRPDPFAPLAKPEDKDPADKPDPFDPPAKPEDSDPLIPPTKPEDKEPTPKPEDKEPEPMPEDKEPEDMSETMPPLLDPSDDGAAKPIKMTAGYAQVLRTVEERLARGSLKRINIDIALEGQPDQDVPAAHPIEDEEYEQRSWALTTYMWTASSLCHKPLYFEQAQVERYGHAKHPLLQPVCEGAHFFATVPILPYKMGLQTPHECVYALGYYRPGSCAPYLVDPVPLSLRGALFQGAAVGLGVSLLP